MSDTLLPPNATAFESAMEGAAARISDVPVLAREVKRAAVAPESVLPWLAWEFSADNWAAGWTVEQKRQAIAQSVGVHRIKGTIGAVRGALAALGYEVRVQEWFNQSPAGTPYTFRVNIDVNQTPLDLAGINRILDVIDSAKNLRSHMDKAVVGLTTNSVLTVGGVTSTGTETVVENGLKNLDLMMEGATNGFSVTEAAVDKLHNILHNKIPAPGYW